MEMDPAISYVTRFGVVTVPSDGRSISKVEDSNDQIFSPATRVGSGVARNFKGKGLLREFLKRNCHIFSSVCFSAEL